MPLSKMFSPKLKTMPGKVVITEIDNTFGTGKTAMRVVRNTADDAVITAQMSKHTDVVKSCDMTPVMTAFVAAMHELVEQGNAIRISGLGTFYIKTTETENKSKNNGALDGSAGGNNEKSERGIAFTVDFTPDKAFCEAAEKAQAELVRLCETKPLVESVQNMDTMEENGELTSGMVSLINGKRLRIAGDKGSSEPLDGTGLFMVPCDGFGNYKVDRRNWIRVKDSDIGKNVMTEVLFRVPAGLSGKYRIAICTRAPLSGCTKEELLIKKARCSISDALFTVS